MAKRKKYPKLPNGYGSIKYLGKGRRNPYGVYPPCPGFTLDGIPIPQKALCYVDDWMIGFAILTAYKARQLCGLSGPEDPGGLQPHQRHYGYGGNGKDIRRGL